MEFQGSLDPETERIAKIVVDAIFKVHSELGPGLLESIYERCLCLELESRGLRVQQQVIVPVVYLGRTIEPGLRLDLLVEEKIIIETKSVETMHPVFRAQMITYLKLSKKRLGFLVNFNVEYIKDGLKRVVC
ncbi:MAG TPA: GxxExxY protein [Phycisphaerae bacterium]|nr:GxxExxY protein [Phycisphaerae bacterium]